MPIYFASDFHLGIKSTVPKKEREKIVCDWLDSIHSDAEALYLLGDIFDYWFEYDQVVPKGNVRLLSRLASLCDKGVDVHLFTGNHDMWMFGYLEEEIGLTLHKQPISVELNGKKFFMGHGDGLGPGDRAFKLVKKLFGSSLNQWLFARIHPNTGLRIMKFFSRKSRETEDAILKFQGADKEWLILFAEEHCKKDYHDFYLFGHRHLPIDYTLSNGVSRYINTGDWIHHFSYAELNDNTLELKVFDKG